MIAVVISLNILLALFCFYVAWRLWRLQLTLAAIADSLLSWERSTHRGLNPEIIPPAILLGQKGTARLRQQYARLQMQLQQLRRIIFIVSLVPTMGRRLSRLSGTGRRQTTTYRSKRYG